MGYTKVGFWSIGAIPVFALSIFTTALCQDNLAKLYADAQRLQAAGDLAAATRNYEAIIRLQPQMAEAYANLGNLYYQQSQMERAKAAWQKAISIKPGLGAPYFFLGVIAFDAHDYSAALRSLQRAEQLQSSNLLIHSYLGYTQYARASFREAAKELEKAAALDPTDIDVLYHLCKSYGHLARDAFAELQQRFPDSAYTNLVRAHLDEIDGDWKAAGEHYRLALEKMPENTRLRTKLALMTTKAAGGSAVDDPGTADELIDASLSYKDAALSPAQIAEAITRWQSGVHALQKPNGSDHDIYMIAEGYQILSYLSSLAVFEADSDSYRAHELRAQMLEEAKDDQGAIGEYRNVLKRKPELQNIHFAIGTLYWKDQHFDEARFELEQELKTNPRHAQALYELGDICAFNGDARNAERYLLEGVKADPNLVEAHLALEKIYTQRGDFDLSVQHLQKALQIDASDPTVHYRLALVYRKLGRQQDADRELALFNQKHAITGPRTNR